MTDRPTIFISYAHADVRWKDKLLVHLKAALGLDPPVDLWHDRRIGVGDAWRKEIEEALGRSTAAVLIVSAHFLASDFIQRNEVPTLLDRYRAAGVRLLPLLVRHCPWQRHPWLSQLQMRPLDGQPLNSLSDVDSGLSAFATEVATYFDSKLPIPQPVDAPVKAGSNEPHGALRPVYRGQHAQQKSEELEKAYLRRQSLSDVGADTTDIETLIRGLRRDLRQGPQLQPGESLEDGRFLLIKELGHGGFATVWLAQDRQKNQRVAIKVLHGQFSTSEERRERLFRGAGQMAKLDHPNVVKVLGEPAMEDGWAYYVMEYLEGGDFRRAVLEGRLSLEAQLDALGKIAAALDYAHGRGIIHRDVKPANILLTTEGEPKLTDFDLVQAEDSTGLTRTRAGMGSYHYAAPECQEDAASATRVCDVYSFAATLAFALSGKELGSRFLFQRPAFLSDLDLPKTAREILSQALDLEPAKRPASAGTFYRELQAALKAKPEPLPEPWPTRSKTSEPEKPTRRSTAVPVARRADPFRTIVTPLNGEVELWREIPAGDGVIGSREREGHSDEKPRHRILVTRPFWMSAVPITNAQYAAFNSKKADLSKPDHPIVNVTWHDATEFCAWLAKEQGFTGARLPTEEEWEYACRAGSETAYWSGDTEANFARVSWYTTNSEGDTHVAGEKPANSWGLYDMHGNVWEWAASVWDEAKYKNRSPKEPFKHDPTETPADLAAFRGQGRTLRGGSCWSDADRARSAFRWSRSPDFGYGDRGFRVLLSSAPSEE